MMPTLIGAQRRVHLLLPLIAMCAIGGCGGENKKPPDLANPPDLAKPEVKIDIDSLTEQAILVLGEGLEDRSWERREQAVKAIQRTADAQFGPALQRHLRTDSNLKVQARSAEAYGHLVSEKAIPALFEVALQPKHQGGPVWLASARVALFIVAKADAGKLQISDPDLLRYGVTNTREEVQEVRIDTAALLSSRPESGPMQKQAMQFLEHEYQLRRRSDPTASNPLTQQILARLYKQKHPEVHKYVTQIMKPPATGQPDEAWVQLGLYLMRERVHAGQTLLHKLIDEKAPTQVAAAAALAVETDHYGCDLLLRVAAAHSTPTEERALALDGIGDCGSESYLASVAPWLERSEASLQLRIAAAGAVLRLVACNEKVSEARALRHFDAVKPSPTSLRLAATIATAQVLSSLLKVTARKEESRENRVLSARLVWQVETNLREKGRPITDPETVRRLSALRNDFDPKDATAREMAVEAGTDEQNLTKLVADGDFAVQFAAAKRLKTPAANAVLLEAMKHKGPDSLQAWGLLTSRGEKVNVPGNATPEAWLLSRYQGVSGSDRAKVVAALSSWPLATTQRIFYIAAEDDYAQVRREAVIQLIELCTKDEKYLSLLRRFFSDPDSQVQLLIRRYLQSNGFTYANVARSAWPEPPPPLPDPSGQNGTTNGQLVLRGEPLVSFTFKDRPMEFDNSRTVKLDLTPGRYSYAYVDAEGKPAKGVATVEAGQTSTVQIPVTAADQILWVGINAYNQGDIETASKKLVKAKQLANGKQSRRFSARLQFHLALVYEKRKLLTDAAPAYEKYLKEPAANRSPSEDQTAEAALQRLTKKLGRLQLTQRIKGKCETEVTWLFPGMFPVTALSQTVDVPAGVITKRVAPDCK